MAKKPAKPTGEKPKPSEGAAVSQPRTSTVLRWSPDKITLAEQLAGAGNFTLMGELCEKLMGDDRVSQALDRLFSATTLPLTFVLPGKSSEDSKNDKVCQALDYDFWKMVPEGTAREIVAWLGLARRCLVHVDEWVKDPETGRVLPKFTVWSLRYVRNDPERGWVARVSNGGSSWSSDEVSIETGDGSWFFITSGSSWRTVLTASWVGCSRFWLLKAYATVDWPSSSERHGQGTTVLENTNGEIVYTEQQKKELARQIDEGGRNKTFVLPDGYKASLLLDTANTYQTFKAQIEVANTAISLNLVGTNLTTEVRGGSYAATSVHQDIDASKFRGLLETISTGLHDGPLVFWGFYNFGTSAVVPYPSWDTTPPEDRKAEAETQVQASTAALNWQKVGFKLSRSALSQKWGLVEAEKGEDELVPVTPPAAPSPFDQTVPPKQTKKTLGFRAESAPETAFARGREYVDELEVNCCRHTAKAFSPLVAATLAAVEESTGFTDLQDRLRAIYQDELPPSKLLKVTEAALIMAQMAGRETVEQELTTEE